MSGENGAEAAPFPEKEYISRIFVAVQNLPQKYVTKQNLL